MLLSERQERTRRFKLALRAGIPVILLVSLVFYSTFLKDNTLKLTLENGFLIGAVLFITVYFIYFLMELSAKETLVDQTTYGFNEKSFIKQLQIYKPKTLVLLLVENFSIIHDNYSIDDSVKLKSTHMGDILPRVYLPLIDENVSLSFNLSPFSLRDKIFQKKFFDYLEKSKIDPSRLIIELYERKTHHDLSGYLQTLNKFRARGVRIAIDNFGSSNASMEYMKNFNFDLVQFDRDYVTKLNDTNTYAMFSSMVKMSKDLNIITVAKWVDNESQKTKLRELGIDYLQGFGISKPISEQTLIDSYN